MTHAKYCCQNAANLAVDFNARCSYWSWKDRALQFVVVNKLVKCATTKTRKRTRQDRRESAVDAAADGDDDGAHVTCQQRHKTYKRHSVRQTNIPSLLRHIYTSDSCLCRLWSTWDISTILRHTHTHTHTHTHMWRHSWVSLRTCKLLLCWWSHDTKFISWFVQS